MIVYTLGTDRKAEEDFVEILNYYGIEAVIDTRRFPRSKFSTYNRENLETLLESLAVEYHFMGELLGGFRRGGYEEYSATGDYKRGIVHLEEIAGRKTSAVLCAEKLPWKCHRRWIARSLKEGGWKVIHILDKGKVWAPK